MTTETNGVALEYDFENGSALLRLPEAAVGRDALLDALLTLIDRAYVYVGEADAGFLVAKVQPRGEASEEQVDELVQELARSIASFALHRQVLTASGSLRDYSITQALFGQTTAPSIDALLAELDDEELGGDGYDYEVPWSRPEGESDAVAPEDASNAPQDEPVGAVADEGSRAEAKGSA